MKIAYLPVLLLLLSTTEVGAQVKQRTIRGYMGLEGGESFTYEMEFRDSVGHIQGYAYTWLQKGKEVKASIKGMIDRRTRTLSFQEDEILYNKGFESNVTICLVKAALNYQKNTEGTYTLSGSITSKDIGNAYCGSGTISFLDSDQVRDLFNEPQPPATSVAVQKPAEKPKHPKPMRIVYDTVARPAPKPVSASPQPEKITAGKDKFIDWHTDTVVMEIWDNSQIDGDEVSVQFDSKTVLPKYTLGKEKKVLRLPLEKDKAEIRLTAGSEGSFPPNTVDIVLVDGDKTHRIIANNSIGKQAIIRLQKVR